jgi:lipopolysaccharide export LptBFGC system permease protein LptF
MLQSHYLPADAFELIGALCVKFPVLACVAVLMLFGAAMALLRRRFGRGGGDLLVIALFIVVLTIFTSACLYLLATHPGYRVFHPGF